MEQLLANSKPKSDDEEKSHLMKGSWNLGKTGTIRIPLKIKDQIISIARHLDDGGKIVLRNIGVNTYREKKAPPVLSQDDIEKAVAILKDGITSQKAGGSYQSGSSSKLKKKVIQALEILEHDLVLAKQIPLEINEKIIKGFFTYKISQRKLAKQYGVSNAHVSRIVRQENIRRRDNR